MEAVGASHSQPLERALKLIERLSSHNTCAEVALDFKVCLLHLRGAPVVAV